MIKVNLQCENVLSLKYTLVFDVGKLLAVYDTQCTKLHFVCSSTRTGSISHLCLHCYWYYGMTIPITSLNKFVFVEYHHVIEKDTHLRHIYGKWSKS